MTSNRGRAIAMLAALSVSACGAAFVPVQLSEPAVAARAPVQASVTRLYLTDNVLASGLGDDTMLVVELTLTNSGATPYRVSTASFSCLMAIDARRPTETRSLLAMGGGDGPFPGELPAERAVLAPVEVPPGQTRNVWALFGGYRFADSDLPRRIVLEIPGGDGRPLTLTLADPAAGQLRWSVPPPRTGFVVGLQNSGLAGDHLQGLVMGTQLSFLTRLGPTLLDVALAQALLIETKGTLISSTSAFSGTGLGARLSVPVFTWGSPQDPRQIGVYGGATAMLLTEIAKPPPEGEKMKPPHLYGAYVAEAGLELAVGALRFAATPFPLTPGRAPLPRWAIRLGYVHWWVDKGGTDGYTTSLRLTW